MNILVAAFPAEESWARAGSASLSPLRTGDSTVCGPDEVLFPLCSRSDLLCTRLAREAVLREYHAELGFQHAERASTLDASDRTNTYSLLQVDRHEPWLSEAVESGACLAPWAITHESAALLAQYGCTDHPPVDTVARVNSKAWSTELRRRMDPRDPAVLVSSAEQLLELGTFYLQRFGTIVLKEPYGVSGSGSVGVNTPRRLDVIARNLSAQQSTGALIEIIVEPFLRKAFDFSMYVDLPPGGGIERVGLQESVVAGFGWSAAMPLTPEHEALVCTPAYFSSVERVCAALREEGYAGPVCIDSMALVGGEIAPLVEVNARWSMGRVNHALTLFLARHRLKSYFSSVRTSLGRERFAELFETLRRSGGVFDGNNEEGRHLTQLKHPGRRTEPRALVFCRSVSDPRDDRARNGKTAWRLARARREGLLRRTVIAILSSAIGLGVYVPSLLLREELAAAGAASRVFVFESFMRPEQREAIVKARSAYQRNSALIRIGQQLLPRIHARTALNCHEFQDAVDQSGVSHFIVLSGFWLPVLARLARTHTFSTDLLHVDAALSPSWEAVPEEAEALGARHVWLSNVTSGQLDHLIHVDCSDLPFADRKHAVLAHGGGWSLGAYLGRTDAMSRRDLTCMSSFRRARRRRHERRAFFAPIQTGRPGVSRPLAQGFRRSSETPLRWKARRDGAITMRSKSVGNSRAYSASRAGRPSSMP